MVDLDNGYSLKENPVAVRHIDSFSLVIIIQLKPDKAII